MIEIDGRMAGPGGVRRVLARWVVTGRIVLTSAAHLGGEDEGHADLILLRDRMTGRPLLTGTSLAGALRSHLTDHLSGYHSEEDSRVAWLFGGSRGDDSGSQSPLVVFDSVGALDGALKVEIRDGIAIDAGKGTAEEHKKFDIEVLPAGTCFPVRIELLIEDSAREAEQLSLMLAALAGLAPGEISLGSRRARGLGSVEVDAWRARRFEFASASGWLEWLTEDPLRPIPEDWPSASDAGFAVRGQAPDLVIEPLADQRRRIVVTVQLKSPGGVLIRSAPDSAGAPDAAHLSSGGHSVLPGTSLGGVLRAHASRIANLVRREQGDADAWISRLFGPRHSIVHDPPLQLHASRIRISEKPIRGGTRLRPSHIRVDRFTQGVMQGLLFEVEPDYGGMVDVRLELRNPCDGEAGLLLLLLKDLLAGDIVVGGTGSVGRGVVHGSAHVRFPDGTERTIHPAKPLDAAALAAMDKEINDFHRSRSLTTGGAKV